jgi:hypothetical protein
MLGDLGRARRMAGNPSVTNASDADVTQGLTYGTSQVMAYTGKTDWETDTSNIHYATAVSAAELFASHYIRERFNDQLNISKEHFDTATELCERIADALADAATAGVNAIGAGSVVGSYKSYPMNRNATPYKSTGGGGQYLVGVDDVNSAGRYEVP